MHCREGEYGEYDQSAMYIPVSGLYYQQDTQVFSEVHLIHSLRHGFMSMLLKSLFTNYIVCVVCGDYRQIILSIFEV